MLLYIVRDDDFNYDFRSDKRRGDVYYYFTSVDHSFGNSLGFPELTIVDFRLREWAPYTAMHDADIHEEDL